MNLQESKAEDIEVKPPPNSPVHLHNHPAADSSSDENPTEKPKPGFSQTYDVTLDSAGDFLLRWTLEPAAEIIHFLLEANVDKADLLGFGFSGYGEAEDADLVVMWTDLNGHHLFQVSRIYLVDTR